MCAQDSAGLVAAAMFEHAPCAASLIDAERRILLANPCFERTFGPPAGRRCYEAYKRRLAPCDACPLERTFLGEPCLCTSEEEGLDLANGSVVYSVRAAPLTGSSGEPLVLLMTTDVTRLAALRDELRDAEQLAMVGLTVAGLAHTIKNILAGLDGGTFMIESGVDKSDADRIRAGWAMVQRYIAQVSTLVKNLLSYARPRDLQRREAEPAALLRATADLFEDKATLVGVSLVVEIEPALPRLLVDEEALRACLDNLVTNALDACAWDPDEAKTHHVRLSAKHGEAGWVRLQVSDDGVGISAANQKKVLSALFTTKGMRGTGLGLLLTRKAVEAHGGRVLFSSFEGEGSTFTIELPPATHEQETAMSKVLIIDDEEDVRKYLAAILKKAGYETVTAADGNEGLSVARRERPDLVTLDLMMPNQSGTDFYRNLARDKELAETPVIIVSGLPGRHLSVREPAAVFDKPIDPTAFLEAVKKAIG